MRRECRERFPPAANFKGNRYLAIPVCITARALRTWCMSGSLTCGDGENIPGIPGACAPAILRIWQEAHYWGCVMASWPLSPRLLVTLQILITTNHIQHSWWCHSKIGAELMWCSYHVFTIWQNMSISNNVDVIWMFHINENLYIKSGSMLTFSNW